MPYLIKRLATQKGKSDSRDPEVAIEYFVKATGPQKPLPDGSGETALEAYVHANIPQTYAGLTDRHIDIVELGGGAFTATATFKLREGAPVPSRAGDPGGQEPAEASPGEDDPLDETYSFKTGGGTRHIKTSLRTVSRTGRGSKVPPNFHRAIGVEKGKVGGCDVYTGKLEFSMTKQIPAISLGYIRTLANLTGTVNDAEWYGFEEGELLFLGATGQTQNKQDSGGWQVTYDFAVSENETDIVIYDGSSTEGDLVVATKFGWDYLWVHFEQQEDNASNELTQIPLAAYVEQVYHFRDFTTMGIG